MSRSGVVAFSFFKFDSDLFLFCVGDNTTGAHRERHLLLVIMVIWSEQAKLWLLFLCLAGCVVSLLLTSTSSAIDIPALRYIPGSSRHTYCKGMDGMAGTRCEKAVQKAYRYINMAGCIKPLRAKALCEHEWCTGHTNDMESSPQTCSTKCSQVRKDIQDCVDRTLYSYLERYGIGSKDKIARLRV
jgi:hypothetical protein